MAGRAFPVNRYELIEVLKWFVWANNLVEPTHMVVSLDAENNWRTWTRNEWGGTIGDMITAGGRPTYFLGIEVEWGSGEFRLECRDPRHPLPDFGWTDEVKALASLVFNNAA